MSNDPAADCLKAAFAALLRGDTKERDRQCERGRRILNAQETRPEEIELVRRPDGSYGIKGS